MTRDLPGPAAPSDLEGEDERPRSLLASRAFWLGGLLSLAVWVLLYLAIFGR